MRGGVMASPLGVDSAVADGAAGGGSVGEVACFGAPGFEGFVVVDFAAEVAAGIVVGGEVPYQAWVVGSPSTAGCRRRLGVGRSSMH